MAGRRLATNVIVGGDLHLAGSTPPKEVADQITNPNAWGEAEAVVAEAPPRAGKGSGLEVWKEYADGLSVTYPDDATRDDVIAAVEAAGHTA